MVEKLHMHLNKFAVKFDELRQTGSALRTLIRPSLMFTGEPAFSNVISMQSTVQPANGLRRFFLKNKISLFFQSRWHGRFFLACRVLHRPKIHFFPLLRKLRNSPLHIKEKCIAFLYRICMSLFLQ